MAERRIIDGYTTPGTERETVMSVEALLGAMDVAGVARAVIAPDDRELAVDNVAGNARVAAMASRTDGRLIAACGANPWFGDQSIESLREARASGARMLVLAPALQGFSVVDELVDPLMRAAGELSMPVYVHTGQHAVGSPAQVLLLAERHASTRIILGHCGTTDYVADMRFVLEAALPNLWYELSFVRPFAMSVLHEAGGSDRFIWGSGAPRNDMSMQLRHFDEHWPIDEHPVTYAENLLRLLGEVAG
ncbi:MAG: amidohydrolase [Planctomycetaceae bacterium]|nr:amidohydrolase [Planctomycetaceae bacterium]